MTPRMPCRKGIARALVLVALGCGTAAAVRGETVELVATRDNTLYENTAGSLSNGAGSYFFVGNTNQVDAENTRRGLVRFNVAAAVPAGSSITGVTLQLYMSKTSDTAARNLGFYRVLADWGEGTSNDNAQEGQGAPATAGDATWIHRFYNTSFWTAAGGDVAAAASATTSVGIVVQSYSWTSTAMRDDVQAWLDTPSANFGWLVLGEESTVKTSRRFNARENNTAAQRPRLTITYTPPADTGGCCFAAGTCSVLTPLDCSSQGGIFQTLGSSCNPNPCPQPTGACCLGDGSCQEVTASQCTGLSGLYHGDGSSCAAVSCPVVTGACCVPGNPGSCQTLTASQCTAAVGSFLGDATQCGVDLCPFVDPLPLPAVAQPTSGTPGGAASYLMAITEVEQQLHRDLAPSTVWTYGGTYPGPTIETAVDQPVEVTWWNDLRDGDGVLRTHHLLPVELCLHGPDMAGDAARVVTHLHGGHVPAAVDGYPEATSLPGEQQVYAYPNHQPPATLWYHDHALGITRLNVYLGLAGFYLVRDAVEAALGLPAGDYEIPLVLQDRSFAADGALSYPAAWDEHFFGDKILVNGKVWPYLEVDRGKYRFRILDGANSRTFRLRLSNDATFQQIGTDGGLLPAPVPLTELVLTPGERADVVLDFAGYANGTVLHLVNDAPAPFPGAPGVGVVANVLELRVQGPMGHTDPLPASLRPVDPLPAVEAVATRTLELQKFSDACGGAKWLINGLEWDDITERPVLGTSEIWRFVNRSGVVHPMHMHLVMFQILDRQPFAVVDGQIVPLGSPALPPANEAGWKDTVAVYPSEITRVIARFTDYAGKYPYHCHVLEHEDHEMMRQFETLACALPAPAITAPTFAAVGATGLQASVPAQAGAAFAWTLADRDGADLGALIQSGQGTNAITFVAASAGQTMVVGVSGTAASGCPIPAAARRVQVDFLDVAPASGFHDFIGKLVGNGVSAGCGGGQYCPGEAVTRQQMAHFLLAAKEGAAYTPPACTADPYPDVAAADPFCRWIQELVARGVTSACGSGGFCPGDPVRRDLMARLVVKTLESPGADCLPSPFSDVASDDPACRWINELAALGATAGCGGGKYCPSNPLTREEMALVLVKAFGLAFP